MVSSRCRLQLNHNGLYTVVAATQSESTAVRFLAIKVCMATANITCCCIAIAVRTSCYTEEGDCTMAVGGVFCGI